MKEEITRCDICANIIPFLDNDGMTWPERRLAQAWPTKSGDKEVCCECVQVLSKAYGLGLVWVDMAALYKRAGWVEDKDCWRYEPEVITISLDDLTQGIEAEEAKLAADGAS